MKNSINMELLKKENVEHEKLFKEFHKCIFRQMSKEAIKMAVTILLDHGWYPTDLDFKEKSNELVWIILKKKWYVEELFTIN